MRSAARGSRAGKKPKARAAKAKKSKARAPAAKTTVAAPQKLPPAYVKLPPVSTAPVKPPIEECIEYAKKVIGIYLTRHAIGVPPEQQEEITQNAYLRIWEAYARLDGERGWKAFVQKHCHGSVLDYLRDGKGYKETGCGKYGREDSERLRFRVEIRKSEGGTGSGTAPGKGDRDDEIADVEEAVALFGIYVDPNVSAAFNPNWPLIARMASVDVDVHLVAKILLGFTQTELAESFGVTRERLGQRIRLFFDRLDDPRHYGNRWTRQTIFAFGLWEKYQMEKVDNGLGWKYPAIDLFQLDSVKEMRTQVKLVVSEE